MTSEPPAADYFTTGAFMQEKHGGRLNLRYSEGDISCRTLQIVKRKAALDTQGHMRSPDIEYFTAERPDSPSQYHFKLENVLAWEGTRYKKAWVRLFSDLLECAKSPIIDSCRPES